MSDRQTTGEYLYHAAVAADWRNRSTEHYQPAAYLDEGFVHLSSKEQLIGTLHKRFQGRDDLVLLTIDPAVVTAELIWEDLYGSGVDFPHIYGPIELAAVVSSAPLACDADGRFDGWRPEQRHD